MRLPLLAIALLLAGPATAQELRAQLDISFRGITGGSVGISASESGGRYVVVAQGRPAGVMGALVEYSYDGEARGTVAGERYVSATYDEIEVDQGTRTAATTTFQGGRVTGVTFTPPRPPEPWDLIPTEQSGVIDTLTALYILLKPVAPGGACNQRFDLFDGRHVSRLTLNPGQAGANGGVTCSGEYRRLRGYSPEEMAKRPRVAMAFAYGPAGAGQVQLTEMRATSRLGDAVLRRQ